jgi:hypothetical protein
MLSAYKIRRQLQSLNVIVDKDVKAKFSAEPSLQ